MAIGSTRRGPKTTRSRRTLALPAMVVEKMRTHRDAAEKRARDAGMGWDPDALVFGTSEGTEMDAANVRRDFRRALTKVPSVTPEQWTPREMLHSFVSLLSDSGVSIEQIARLVGHKGGSAVIEKVYRKQLRPVIQTGAIAHGWPLHGYDQRQVEKSVVRQFVRQAADSGYPCHNARPVTRRFRWSGAFVMVGDTGIEPASWVLR